MRKTILATLAMLAAGCAAMIYDKPVTLVGDTGQFSGIIKYDGFYSGTLTIEDGPGGESFTGRYVVVDHTSTSRKQGGFVVPASGGNGQMPAMGGMSAYSSGEIMATGYWYGVGDKGGVLNGVMGVGSQGHGHGVCVDDDGNEYQIVF